MSLKVRILIVALLSAVVGPGVATAAPTADANTPATSEPATDLDYWLRHATPVDPNSSDGTPAATRPADANTPTPGDDGAGRAVVNPFSKSGLPFRRADAVPGVVELSDGKQLPGGIYTTVEKPFIVWSETTKSWRRVELLAVLSIEAVVEQERMELVWRWKGTGEPEKVYTGRKYPMRRLHWRFRLIDGSVIEGATKGQPIFAERGGKVSGPFLLSERTKGKEGQTLADLVYVRKIVLSRKMMDLVIRSQ